MENKIKEVIEIEREAKKIIDDAQNKANSIKTDAEKEARKIVLHAKKEAELIIDRYRSNLSKTQEKEKKEVEEKNVTLKNDWMKHYDNEREELLAKLISFL